MNEKELGVKLSEQWVEAAADTLSCARRLCVEGHRKLETEFENTIFNLEHSIREAKISRENIDKKASQKDILLADAQIDKAEQALKFGRIRAQADFETGYMNLKQTVRQHQLRLDGEKLCLEFAKAELERGF